MRKWSEVIANYANTNKIKVVCYLSFVATILVGTFVQYGLIKLAMIKGITGADNKLIMIAAALSFVIGIMSKIALPYSLTLGIHFIVTDIKNNKKGEIA